MEVCFTQLRFFCCLNATEKRANVMKAFLYLFFGVGLLAFMSGCGEDNAIESNTAPVIGKPSVPETVNPGDSAVFGTTAHDSDGMATCTFTFVMKQAKPGGKYHALPIQRKRLNGDEVSKLANACENFRERFVIWLGSEISTI